MARPATGSARWNPTEKHWEARVTLPGQGRKAFAMVDTDGRPTVPACVNATPLAHGAEPECASCRQARHVARLMSTKMRGGAAAPEEVGETSNDWHERYLQRHAELGHQTRDMPGAWNRWLSPVIGPLRLASVTREHVIRIRDSLTRAVHDGQISAKRAMNLWSDLIVAPLSRAFTDDDPRYSSVRVGPANANPAAGVKPPVTKEQLDEDRRERQPMHPHEFVRLLACGAIPVEALRIYVLATYLYLRPQELYALRFSDVDWTAREVRIRRKLDVRTGEEKSGTKSDAGVREVPIHPNLMPLLEAMRAEAEDDSDRIVPLVGAARLFERFADQTRRHLKLAGIDRVELVIGGDDLMPFDFRSWRTTGCTWLAMLGTDSYVIALQAGHKSPDTTWSSYIKRGPDLRQRYGEPFPALPARLFEAPRGFGRVSAGTGVNPSELLRRGRDSNPRSGFSPTPA